MKFFVFLFLLIFLSKINDMTKQLVEKELATRIISSLVNNKIYTNKCQPLTCTLSIVY